MRSTQTEKHGTKQIKDSSSAVEKRARAVSSKSERTAKLIKESARGIFAKKGFEATKISDIVAEINMAQGTFFYHYPDKKSILIEIVEEFLGEIKNMASIWAVTTDTGRDAAFGFARRLAAWLNRNRETASIIRKEYYNHDPDIRAIINEFYNYIYQQTDSGLKLGMKLGVVRRMDSRIAAVALVGMVESVFEDQLDSDKPADIDMVINEVTNLQNFGIRPRRRTGIF